MPRGVGSGVKAAHLQLVEAEQRRQERARRLPPVRHGGVQLAADERPRRPSASRRGGMHKVSRTGSHGESLPGGGLEE